MILLRTYHAFSAGGRVEVAFALTQHARDIQLIEYLRDFFFLMWTVILLRNMRHLDVVMQKIYRKRSYPFSSNILS